MEPWEERGRKGRGIYPSTKGAGPGLTWGGVFVVGVVGGRWVFGVFGGLVYKNPFLEKVEVRGAEKVQRV